MIVRSFWQATKIENTQPPYDTIQLKVFYPGSTTDNRQILSSYPADCSQAPFPVVIFFSGVNCNLAMYEWLAVELVSRGLVVVLFNWLAENIPGHISLTPGVNLAAFAPEVYGTIPTASTLPRILTELERLQSQGTLKGLLDLNKIILGGHSAGGRVALENAEGQFFSSIAAAFAYGAHTAAPVQAGYEPGTILPLPNSVPMLLIGGTHDGVIANNSRIYGVEQWSTAATPIIRTFREAITRKQADAYLLVLEGANHFSFVDRLDPTLPVAALDFPSTQPPAQLHSLMANAIGLFVDRHVRQESSAFAQLEQLLESNSRLITTFEHK